MRAMSLKHEGWSQRTIAEALGVSRPAVSQWLAAAERGGPNALRSHFTSWPRLSTDGGAEADDTEILWHGPEHTASRVRSGPARIAQVIEEEFGVRYHKDHVSRLLKQLQWTAQMPIRRAIHRDEPAIKRWRAEVWPELRKRAWREPGCWFSRTNRGFTSCRGWLGRTLPRGRRRSSTRNKPRPPVGHGRDDP